MTLSDIKIGVYHYCADWHGGQWSREYSILSRIRYRPSPLCRGIEDEDEEAQEVYRNLVRARQGYCRCLPPNPGPLKTSDGSCRICGRNILWS